MTPGQKERLPEQTALREKRIREEREQARHQRELAARDLHRAYLYGGPLEAQHRASAEVHLEAARRHERTAAEIERTRGGTGADC
jgi:hypothetical protein